MFVGFVSVGVGQVAGVPVDGLEFCLFVFVPDVDAGSVLFWCEYPHVFWCSVFWCVLGEFVYLCGEGFTGCSEVVDDGSGCECCEVGPCVGVG